MSVTGPAAVLFDMDGTLVDSEKVWDVALRELAARYGGVLSDPARQAMIGTDAARTMLILHEDLGQPWRDPVAGAEWVDNRVLELFATGLEWQPGAQELLTAVREERLPTALVTNTARSVVEVALETLGRANFDVLVCAGDVARAKPHPEPYLTAAAALGVDPAACVAIEDSPAGVASALAAGCAVIAVPLEMGHDHGTALVLPSLREVDLTVLSALIAGRVVTGLALP